MAKADALRDYYKDLEVSPQADTDEIKKQYRKLALKYHPDRNRGHEDEASLKFQNIQAANEVLTDPQERAKYDAGRRRAAGLSNNRASNLRKNPYESTPYYPKGDATGFPPPPRRTQPQAQPQRPAFTSSASAFTSASGGARRYQGFAAGSSKSSTHHSMPRTESPGPMYSTSPPKGRNARSAHPAGPPPGLSRSQTTRAPKPGTFNPNSMEDEPPAKTASNYYNILRGDKAAPPRNVRSSSSGSSSSDSSSPAPPPRTSFNPPLPPREQQRRAAESESNHAPPPPLGRRTKTSYSSVGGDRLDPFAEAFNRSASMNEGNGNRNGHAPGGLNNVQSPTDRHRSASPPRNRYTADFVNSSSRHDRASGEPPRRTNSAEDRSTRASQKGPQNKTRDRQNFPFVEDDPSDEEHFYSSTGASETVERMMEEELHRRQTKKREGVHRYKINRLSGEYTPRDKASPRIPSSGEMPPPPPTARMEGMNLSGKSKSRENSGRVDPSSIPDSRGQHPDGSHSQFQPNVWSNERFFGSEERRDSTASDRRGRPPARHEASFSKSPKNMSSAFPQMNGAPTESPRNSKFSEGDWASGFNSADFVNTSGDGRASPTRGGNPQSSSSASRSRGTKTRKPSKRSGTSKHAGVVNLSEADDDEEIRIGGQHRNGLGRSSGHSSGRDSGAMDIDSPQPQPERTESFDGRGSASRRSRMDSYDRNRPEFRKEGSYQVNGASSTSKRPVPAPPHAPSPPQNPGPFNLEPMRNVEPLGRTSSGLQDMKDVGASLPFESRPSSRPPNLSDSDQQQFPQPPSPPPVPGNTKDWEVYVQAMKVYLSQWDQFNWNVLSHFEKNQTKRKQMGSDWVGLLSESEKAGYFRYQKLVDDDIAWRVWWTKKCDEHQRTMRNFGHVREVVRKTTSESSRGR